MELKRSSGVLLHPTSLPGRFSIGDFGENAYRFIDLLVEAEQSWWQILPLTPPGYGGSPYGSTSSFSINMTMVDPMWLYRKGWLTQRELEAFVKRDAKCGDLSAIVRGKRRLLDTAYQRWNKVCFTLGVEGEDSMEALDLFYRENCWWLFDDALYTSLKVSNRGLPWYKWSKKLIQRDRDTLERASRKFTQEISKYIFGQWVAHMQWSELRGYAASEGIEFIGDLPIFVSMDSFDVWANREVFQVGMDGRYDVVAGVPPDYFCATGQKWGNPLYRWEDQFDKVMQWWVRRIQRTRELVDMIRIDHFRAFQEYWEVPAMAKTAETGEWREGPGDKFFEIVREKLGDVPFIAEDLGLVSKEVYELRDRQGLPGMKVLEFAFDGNPEHPFLPHMYPELCVAYPGTHDNNTLMGWLQEDASDVELHNARVYYSATNEELPKLMMESLAKSKAGLVIFQMQDVFRLSGSARMNTPGLADGNWKWRMEPWMLDQANREAREAWEWLARVTLDSDRVKI